MFRTKYVYNTICWQFVYNTICLQQNCLEQNMFTTKCVYSTICLEQNMFETQFV